MSSTETGANFHVYLVAKALSVFDIIPRKFADETAIKQNLQMVIMHLNVGCSRGACVSRSAR